MTYGYKCKKIKIYILLQIQLNRIFLGRDIPMLLEIVKKDQSF